MRYFKDFNGNKMTLDEVRYDYHEFMISLAPGAEESEEDFLNWIDEWWLGFDTEEITEEEYYAEEPEDNDMEEEYEEPADLEMGFDPYIGCYSFDC